MCRTNLGSFSTGTINFDCSAGPHFEFTITGSVTLAEPTNLRDGESMTWKVTRNGSGISFTWDADYVFPQVGKWGPPSDASTGYVAFTRMGDKYVAIGGVPGLEL